MGEPNSGGTSLASRRDSVYGFTPILNHTMSATLSIHDETTSGRRTHSFTLEFFEERLTVRELIRARIYQEVQDHNQSEREVFQGLVQPTQTEKTLSGPGPKMARAVGWQKQFELALEAFQRNGFFVIVGDHQVETLDEEFTVTPETEISFVKLTPLVGG